MKEVVFMSLHCPNCKSTSISPINESSVNSSVSTSHRSGSSTLYSNIHRSFWVCSNCGNKFRNIQSLEEEIERTKKQVIYAIVFTIISVIASIIFISVMTSSILGFIMIPLSFAGVVTAIVSFCLIFSYKGKVKKMEKELSYLKHNCFN